MSAVVGRGMGHGEERRPQGAAYMLAAAIARAKKTDVSPEQVRQRLATLGVIAAIALVGAAASLLMIGVFPKSETAQIVIGFGLFLSVLLILACGLGTLLVLWTTYIYRYLAALDAEAVPEEEKVRLGSRFSGLELDTSQESVGEAERRISEGPGILAAIAALCMAVTVSGMIRLWPVVTPGPAYSPPEQLVVLMISLMGFLGGLLRLSMIVTINARSPHSFAAKLLMPVEGAVFSFMAYILLRGVLLSPGFGTFVPGQLNLLAFYGAAGILGFFAVDITEALGSRIEIFSSGHRQKGG